MTITSERNRTTSRQQQKAEPTKADQQQMFLEREQIELETKKHNPPNFTHLNLD